MATIRGTEAYMSGATDAFVKLIAMIKRIGLKSATNEAIRTFLCSNVFICVTINGRNTSVAVKKRSEFIAKGGKTSNPYLEKTGTDPPKTAARTA